MLTAGEHTLRLLPPLVMDRDELARGLSILEKIISELARRSRSFAAVPG